MGNNKRVILIIILGILLIGDVFFGLKYYQASKELEELRSGRENAEFNSQIIDFTSLFINKVLQADKEVDFETRLSLENAVRALKDEEIMAEWQDFISSKTEKEAQDNVKKLLGTLMNKMKTKSN